MRKTDTRLRTLMRDWLHRRLMRLDDRLYGRTPRRYAFRLRDIRRALRDEYPTWDLASWMTDASV